MSEEKKISIVQIIQTIVIAVVIGVAGWMFKTIDDLKNRVVTIEANKKENDAQWRVITANSEKIENNSIEVEVYKKLFTLLVNNKKVDVSMNSTNNDNHKIISKYKSFPGSPALLNREDRIFNLKDKYMMEQREVEENLKK